MIDITYAKQKFQKYLEAYDRSDDRIQLKAVHTAQVGKRVRCDLQGGRNDTGRSPAGSFNRITS